MNLLSISERSANKQLAVNLIANISGFLINFAIQFFITPFIVRSLGTAAYGFVGLSNNIIVYTQLIATALNSMASRFITIKYTKGEIESANKYFSSVYYSNIILSIVIGIILFFTVIFINKFLNVPDELLLDVKCLLAFLSFNYIISLLTNIYSIATFVKNRIDLASIRSIIANVAKALVLLILFAFFSPRLWYIGLAGFVYTIYVSFTNYRFTKILTPEFVHKRQNFEWLKVKELITSGIWNTLGQLGIILGQGLDLIIANLFIGTTAMGVFSISRQIPFIIISLSGTISAVFTPMLTQYYARGEFGIMRNEINKSIRILSLFVSIPLLFMLVFGGDFFKLWVPSEDSSFLHLLTILCGLELIISLPLEIFWGVFLVTNKIRFSTLFMLSNHVLTFVIVLIGVQFASSIELKLIILASTRTIIGLIRSLSFLPMYGAKCLQLPYKTFYPALIKVIIGFLISVVLCFSVKHIICVTSWSMLIFCASICTIISVLSSLLFVLSRNDRNAIKEIVLKKLK